MAWYDGLLADDTTKDEWGQTQNDRRQPLYSGLIKAGLLAIAGGDNIMPAQRAQYLAQAGGALADVPNEMMQQRAQAAQNMLRQQQMKTSGVEMQAKQIEMQAKQADLAQQAKWRAYAESPEFLKAMDQAGATPAERMAAQAQALKGDFAGVAKTLDPKRNQWQEGKEGTWRKPSPDGKGTLVYNPVTEEMMLLPDGGGAPVKIPGAPGAPTAAAPPGAQPPTPQPQPPAVGPPGAFPELAPGAPAPAAAAPAVPATGPAAADAATHTPVPVGADPNQPLLSGEQWNQAAYDKVPDRYKAAVKAIAEYRRQPTETRGAAGGFTPLEMKSISNWVQQVTNGSYRAGNFKTVNDLVNAYAPSGKIGVQLTPMDIAYGHANRLQELADALKSGNAKAINDVKQKIALASGQPNADVIQGFNFVSNAVADELARGITGHVTDAQIAAWKDMLGSGNNPQNIERVIHEAHNLMEERRKSYKFQWDTTLQQAGVKMPFREYLRPENRAYAQTLRDRMAARGAKSVEGAPGGAPPPPAPGGGGGKTKTYNPTTGEIE